jgi:hypothetical protein
LRTIWSEIWPACLENSQLFQTKSEITPKERKYASNMFPRTISELFLGIFRDHQLQNPGPNTRDTICLENNSFPGMPGMPGMF